MAGEHVGNSLQATALVNEVYVRLIDGKAVEWHDRAHFLAVAARVMRRIDLSRPSMRFDFAVGGGHMFFTIDEHRSSIWLADVTER